MERPVVVAPHEQVQIDVCNRVTRDQVPADKVRIVSPADNEIGRSAAYAADKTIKHLEFPRSCAFAFVAHVNSNKAMSFLPVLMLYAFVITNAGRTFVLSQSIAACAVIHPRSHNIALLAAISTVRIASANGRWCLRTH